MTIINIRNVVVGLAACIAAAYMQASEVPKFDMRKQVLLDAQQDWQTPIFEGKSPNSLASDTLLRAMPDGSWVMVMCGGGDREPQPQNSVFITRSTDTGKTWSAMKELDLGFVRTGDTAGLLPTELIVDGTRVILFFSTHNGKVGAWKAWYAISTDSARTWSAPRPAPGRLAANAYVRGSINARDGTIAVGYQFHVDGLGGNGKPIRTRGVNSRNGIIVSSDHGDSWTEYGNVRVSKDDLYFGWTEPSLAQTSATRMVLLIRADNLGGMLYSAESIDGGKTWPEYATPTDIPNPGSKVTSYMLGEDVVAILHNPNSAHRSPLSLWISWDGMKTWPYKRDLVLPSWDEDTKAPKRVHYPHGFVDADQRFIHFAYDDSRHRAIYMRAKLPPLK